MNAAFPEIHVIFLEALKLPPAEWGRFLEGACGDDPALRQRLDQLLAAHQEAGTLHPKGDIAVTSEQSAELIGTLIGPYKLLEQIGEGGMGLVYMAEQQRPMRRLVALKLIKPGMDSKQVIARFEAEKQALAMMDHPCIARVLDAGTVGECSRQTPSAVAEDYGTRSVPTTAGRPYFVMELVRGIPINEFCEQKRLSVRERLALFIQVCQAVQHAHQKGIIHRDLKPSNVLVTMNDALAVPKVIDFGIAKALGQQLTDSTLHTGFAQLVGTPLYMSPEQAELNQLGVDTRSDVYSLGVLLYELLTGTTPFDKQRLTSVGLDEMRRIIREEEPETVSARIAKTRSRHTPCAVAPDDGTRSVPATASSPQPPAPRISELDWIVMKALEKDRNRRYESASALATDIQRFLSDEPVLACPPTTMYRFQKFARKHKPALFTAAAIALCLILGTTVSAWQAARATTAEAQAVANEQQANTQREGAQKQRDEIKALYDKLSAKEQQLQRTLYASNMNLARHAWDAGVTEQVVDLLEQHRPKPGDADLRGFEWHYLHRLCHSDLRTLKGHTGHVSCVAYSPDGKRVASGSQGIAPNWTAEVKVWEATTGRELLSLKGHTGWIKSVAFSPDGKRLASGAGGGIDHKQQKSYPGEIKVWDAETGQELRTFKDFTPLFPNVAFSPDGKRLASSGGPSWEQGELKVWNVQSGEELLTCKGHTAYIESVAYSPDGKQLASCAEDNTVRVWDAQTGEQLHSFKEWSLSVAFSADSKRLASVRKIWDTESGKELVSFGGGGESVAFSPDGKYLACTKGTAAKLRDAETGTELLSFKGHTGPVESVAYSPDGKQLVSASRDGTVKVWDVATNLEHSRFSGHTSFITSVAFSPDGKRLASASRVKTIKLWDAQSGNEVMNIEGHTRLIDCVAYSPDGKQLASAGLRELKIWDALTGKELSELKGHTGAVLCVTYSPDGNRLATASFDKTVKVWDAQTGQELLSISVLGSYFPCVVFSPDGKRLANASQQEVKVWDAQTGQQILSLAGHSEPVISVVFSPDGKRLASSSEGGRMKVWDAQTGQELLTLKGHTGPIRSISFSPDGKRLAGSAENEAKLWDAHTGQELLTLKKSGARGRGLAFSPNGHRLVSAGDNGLTIWDATPLPEKP